MSPAENVVVLFTDVVGSTELATTVPPATADVIRRGHFSSLRWAIASSGGTEVKNLGDGLMVAFATASAALSCAVGMQQAVERDNRSADRPIGLRVGLSGGEVTREDDDYFGEPVVEAARLCALADGGQILAADLVRAMAGRRSTHRFERRGLIQLKGLPEAVDVVEVVWERLAAPDGVPEAIPLQARLSYAPSIGVIGRAQEMSALIEPFKRAVSGDGRQVVLVSGEAGLGKTTLAACAARAAHDDGACALLGRCDESVSAPYRPFVEALSHYVTNAPEDVLQSHVDVHGAELARLIPALGKRLDALPPLQSSDPDTERYLLFGSVRGLLAAIAVAQPLVLVLDDLQWADVPSLQLLRHLVGAEELGRTLIVGTYRDTELSTSHPLVDTLAWLRREPGVHRVELKGLDDTGVIAFVEARAGHDLDDTAVEFAHALYRDTDGNPFFVGEVLRHLYETGSIVQDQSGRWMPAGDVAEMALPDSIREVVSSRVARLGEMAGRVLSNAAVIGKDFDISLLGQASDCSEDEVLNILDAAAAAALVRETRDVPGRYTFSHALVQHTIYQDLGPTRRARAHRRVAEALEDICGGRPGERVVELARHWSNATQPVDPTKAISYLHQAGDAALAALAPEDAVRHFSQALQLWSQLAEPESLLQTDLLLGLGLAQRQAGIAAFRETLLEAAGAAIGSGATDRLVRAALANNRGFGSLGVVDTDRVEVLEAALEAAGDGDSPARALLLAALCNELTYGPLERRRVLADEARAIARRLGEPETLVRVLYTVHLTALCVPETLEERLSDSAEALEGAEALGDPVHVFWAAAAVRAAALQDGDFATAAGCMATMSAVSERLREPTMLWTTRFHHAADALLAGDAARAEEVAAVALQLGTDSGQPDAFAFYGGQLIWSRVQSGRVGELVPLVADSVTQNPGVAGFHAALAMAHLHAGEAAEGSRLLEEAATAGFERLSVDIAWTIAVVMYALAAIELEAEGPAAQLTALLVPYHGQVAFQGAISQDALAVYLGGLSAVLGRYDDAERYFAEAADLHERGGMVYGQAQTDLLWGTMLAARGLPADSARARAMLERARAVAGERGYAMIESRAAAMLGRATGA